jgi:hypothetical protein
MTTYTSFSVNSAISGEKEYTPSEYFEYLKGKKQQITDEELKKVYDNVLFLINKYKTTGQTAGLRKLLFHIECIEKEREIIKSGIDTFVYRDDIEEFIDNISKDVVKIIELRNYEREIPDEIVGVLEEIKDKFDEFYVVFTDYTGKIEKQVEKTRRDKDPILFGVFKDENSRSISDRFYYIGDWEDEYCDLTLDKMVGEFEKEKGKNIQWEISTPEDLEELKHQLNSINQTNNAFKVTEDFKMESTNTKKSFFSRIKTFFTKE